MTVGIYKIMNIRNGKIYVGQSKNIERRFKEHKYGLNRGNYYNTHLENSWNYYSSDDFEFTILQECEEKYLDELERFYIAFYDSMNPDKGYNLESGGNANKTESPETRAKKSKAKSGENNPMYGRRGENNPNFGRKASEETKRKQSEAMSGEKNPMYGRRGEDHPSAKYTLWDPAKCEYDKSNMFRRNRDGNSPCRCFQTKYEGRKLPIGLNLDPFTCEIISDLIDKACK